MKINPVSTSPKFGSTVRYIHNERYRDTLLKNKPFQKLIDKIADNGRNSTVIFIPNEQNIWVWDRFASLSGIKDREKRKWIGWHDLGLGDISNKVALSSPNGSDKDFLNICVTDEIDGKVHLAHGTLRMNEDAARAAFEYISAESVLPENPIDVDPRLNKYLVPKPESRVTLMYENTMKDLYKDEDFIGFMEWLDTRANSGKGKNIIVNPQRNYYTTLNSIDIITAEKTPGLFEPSKTLIFQDFDHMLWTGQQFDSDRIKRNILGRYGEKSLYEDTIKPFNVCV